MPPFPHYELRDRDSDAPIARVAASPFLSAWESLDRAGVHLRTTCRGSTICGLCRVEVVEGADLLPPVLPDEAALLGPDRDATPPVRLACRIRMPAGMERLVLRARGVTRS